MFRNLRRSAAAILFILSMILVVWASLPNKRQEVSQVITPEMMQVSPDGQAGGPLSLPARLVTLDLPVSMRIGEQETITLRFVPDKIEPGSNTKSSAYSDIYQNYSLMAEGRYDVAGMKVDPANPRRESMPAGQPLMFKWQVSTGKEGTYDGTVWLTLRYLPLDGSQASQQPVFIRKINVQTTSLFGLNESTAYLLGGIGILLSIVMVYDDLWAMVKPVLKKINHKGKKDIKVYYNYANEFRPIRLDSKLLYFW